MKGRSCTLVLVGSHTANRKWIDDEIVKSNHARMGVVGLCIHGLEDSNGNISNKGANPFDFIAYGDSGKKLSSIVKCYNPTGRNSKERYAWIYQHLANAIEEGIRIRENN